MNRVRLWTAAIFLFVFADSVALQVRGPILSSLEAEFGASEAALGLVAPAGTLGFVAAIVVTGLLAGRLRIHRTMFVGVVVVGGALLAMSAAPVYTFFLLALFVQGTAAGAFRGVDRVVLSHLHANRRGRVYAAYALVWAVGAVVGPQLVSAVFAVADWRAVFVVVAVLFLPTAVVVSRWELPSMAAERSLSRESFAALARRPPVVGACAGMAFVGAIEGIVFTWLVYYASGFYPATTANVLLSLFLLAYVLARIGYMYVISFVPHLALIVVAVLAAVPAFAVAFSGVTGPVLFFAVFLAGAGVSSGFPILSAYVVEAAPEYTGPLNAMTNGATYLGMSTAPVVVGVLAEVYGIGRAMWVVVVVAVALALTAATTWAWTGTAAPPRVDASSE